MTRIRKEPLLPRTSVFSTECPLDSTVSIPREYDAVPVFASDAVCIENFGGGVAARLSYLFVLFSCSADPYR